MSNTTENSSILLACISRENQCSRLFDFGVDDLHSLFAGFGEVCRVLIFSRRVQLKAFVQFSTPEEARLARSFLHDGFLNDIGPVHVYFSALQGLDFSNRLLECREFAQPRRQSQNTHLTSTRLSVTETMALAEQALMFEDQAFVDDGAHLFRQILAEKRNYSNSAHLAPANPFKRNFDEVTKKPEIVCVTTPLAPSRRSGFLSSDGSQATSRRSSMYRKESPFALSASIPLPAPVLSGFKPRRSPLSLPLSPVILISNLEHSFFTAAELYNVFSCFGNITKVLLMKNLKKALIEFLSEEAALAALDGMDNRFFGRVRVKINFSRFRCIDLKKNNKSENSQQFNEVMLVSPELNRYRDSGAHEACGPSDTLLVVIPKSDDLRPIDLFDHMKGLGRVVGTRTMAGEEGEEGLTKVLFKYRSQEEAIAVLSQSHNQVVNGVVLSGTFSQISL